jgi:hypothetical protein
MTEAITYTNEQGQTVSEVPGQVPLATTGRNGHRAPHNPATDDPFHGIPGAYEDED